MHSPDSRANVRTQANRQSALQESSPSIVRTLPSPGFTTLIGSITKHRTSRRNDDAADLRQTNHCLGLADVYSISLVCTVAARGLAIKSHDRTNLRVVCRGSFFSCGRLPMHLQSEWEIQNFRLTEGASQRGEVTEHC